MYKKIRRFYAVLIAATLFNHIPLISTAQVNMGDSLALVDFYNAAGGTKWTHHNNWLTQNPLDTWYGVKVVHNRVDSLDLTGNNLSITLPPSFAHLSRLRILNLGRNNYISGLDWLSYLTSLEHLNWFLNGGAIPASFAKLTNLKYLDWSYNYGHFAIPRGIFDLVNLVHLDISQNDLIGPIPSNIDSCVSLQYFSLAYNYLMSGTIPPEICNLHKLTFLDLSSCELGGTIPDSIGNLSELEYLRLGYNYLDGPIPSSIGKLNNLKYLDLGRNRITHVPASVGNLVNLEYIALFQNQLTSIPSSIGKLVNLTELYFQENSIEGTIPVSLGNLTNLKYLYLNANKFTGTIPPQLSNLTHIKEMWLRNNLLTGTVPPSFYKLPAASLILLDNNNLSGLIATPPKDIRVDIWVFDNRYNFDAFERALYRVPYLHYSPQHSIELHNNNNVLSVSAGGTLSNNRYKWFKDGVLVKTVDGDSTYKIGNSGSYHVKVTNSVVENLDLFSDTVLIQVADISQTKPAIDNLMLQTQVSPNPATEWLKITLNKSGKAVIYIYDENGKTVYSAGMNSLQNQPVTLPVSKLVPGNYFISAVMDGYTVKDKFIKQ